MSYSLLFVLLLLNREFFDSLGGSEGLLVIQCDSGDQNTNLIACARHLLMEQRNIFIEETKEISEKEEWMKYISPIHIVIVVQLPRIGGGCSDFVGFQGKRLCQCTFYRIWRLILTVKKNTITVVPNNHNLQKANICF